MKIPLTRNRELVFHPGALRRSIDALRHALGSAAQPPDGTLLPVTVERRRPHRRPPRNAAPIVGNAPPTLPPTVAGSAVPDLPTAEALFDTAADTIAAKESAAQAAAPTVSQTAMQAVLAALPKHEVLAAPRIVPGLMMAGYGDLSNRYRADHETRERAMAIFHELNAGHMYRYEMNGEFDELCRSDPLKDIDRRDLVAVRAYTAYDYRHVNQPLLEHHHARVRTLAPYVATMVSGLNQLPVYAGKCYRGVTLDSYQRGQYVQGAVVKMPHFVSTSANADRDFSGNARMIFHALNAADVSTVSVNPREDERIFRPGSRFRVDKLLPLERPEGVSPRLAHLIPTVEIHLTQLPATFRSPSPEVEIKLARAK